MSDDDDDDASRSSRPPPPQGVPTIEYQSPGTADPSSQWMTDDQPGGNWLVGCLMTACAVGLVLGLLGAILSFVWSWFAW